MDYLSAEERNDPVVRIELEIERLRHVVDDMESDDEVEALVDALLNLKETINQSLDSTIKEKIVLEKKLMDLEEDYNNETVDPHLTRKLVIEIVDLRCIVMELEETVNWLEEQQSFVDAELDILSMNPEELRKKIDKEQNKLPEITERLIASNENSRNIEDKIEQLRKKVEDLYSEIIDMYN